MKKIIIPNSLEELTILKGHYDGILVGVQGLSVNVNLYLNVDEIRKLGNKTEVFVALNKNMHNQDLELLEKVMMNLENIKGVFFYDAAVTYLYNKLKPFYELIWSQEHHATSSASVSFWASRGASGAYLSGEITLAEILKIREKYS